MKRILFVDDETRVIDGLQRMLHRYRVDWDMSFVNSAASALHLMDEDPFDVIVSDIRMPGMDGAALLKRVRDDHPRTVRIVLSGHAELDVAMKTIPMAHQFLAKPCESERIREVITRMCSLHALLQEPSLREIVGGIDALPSLPVVYNELTIAMSDPEVHLAQIAAIVERDIGITAKILQLVNSSFFGIPRQVDTIRDATSFLGMNMIRNLVLSAEVFRAFVNRGESSFSIDQVQAHAELVGRIARQIMPEKNQAESAFLAGMLHDLGHLILQSSGASQRAARKEADGEVDGALGYSHAEVGAYLLGLWGLPYPIVEAVANHHHPSSPTHRTLDLLEAVHIADALAVEYVPFAETPAAELDLDYLASLGVADRLPEWRDLAAVQAGASRGNAA